MSSSDNIFAGHHNHSIIRVSHDEIIYRVAIDIHDTPWYDGATVAYVSINDFHLVLTDNGWRFSNFHIPR